MKIKKLLISCAALFSCFGLMAFGVHAAIACEVVISGTVSYTVTAAVEGELKAYITDDNGTTKSYYNSQTGAKSATEVTNFLTRGTSSLADWDLGSLKFKDKADILENISDPVHDIEIYFSFKNNSQVSTTKITMTPPTIENVTIQYQKGSTTTAFTTETVMASVAPNQTAEFKIIMSVTNTGYSVTANNVNFGFVMNAAQGGA